MKLGVYLQLGRVSNLPTVWSNALAGLILAGGSPAPVQMGLLAGALSLFYLGGMFLNDAFDRKVDARQRPERPIPSGRIGATEVFVIGFGLLGAGLGVLALEAFVLGGRGSVGSLFSGLGLAGAVVLYDVWHKNNPLSPLLMGLCRMLVYLTAALAVVPDPTAALAGALVLLAYLIGLTFVAKQESLGRLRNRWPLWFLLAPFVYCAPAALESRWVATLFIALALWLGFTLWQVRRRKFGQAVVQFIAGISLLDALLIVRATQDAGLFPALIATFCFGMTLLLQRQVKGT